MISFSLNPSSGYSNSYIDVKFSLHFEKSDEIEISLFNKTDKSDIEILSVSQGYIQDSSIIKCKNTSFIEGNIYLFAQDKINSRLDIYEYVEIEVKCKFIKNGIKKEENKTTYFYNESKSLDSSVMPFELIIHNNEINIEQNEPLKMSIICDISKKFEFSLKSINSKDALFFEAVTTKGRVDFEIPCPVMFNDLSLSFNKYKFDVYWTKFEGVNYSRFMNRKFIKIPNTTITFKGDQLRIGPQNRNTPFGVFSDNFVLSDRYFVHTHKNFSGLSQTINNSRLKRLSFLFEESQLMQNLNKMQDIFNTNQTQQQSIRKGIRDNNLVNTVKNLGFDKNRLLPNNQTKLDTPKVNSINKSDCGCSRKNK